MIAALAAEVKSSSVQSLAWVGDDPRGGVLYAVFNNGAAWVYGGVPQHEFVTVTQAKSVGSMFNTRIKRNTPRLYSGAELRKAP